MKLRDYLTESKSFIDDYDVLIDLIRKNCKQYIKEVNETSKKNRIFIRNITSMIGSDDLAFVQDNRSGRKPKDTKQEFHKKMDDFFYDKFKIRGRSETWFVWSRELTESILKLKFPGRLVFPYDGYEYIWSPELHDLIISDEKEYKKWLEQYSHTYKTKDALKSKQTFLYHEVMLQASKCIFVNLKKLDNINKFYKNIGIKSIRVKQ